MTREPAADQADRLAVGVIELIANGATILAAAERLGITTSGRVCGRRGDPGRALGAFRERCSASKRSREPRSAPQRLPAAVFADIGFLNATVADIAKAAKCSPALFYYHFDSKEGILIALSATSAMP